MGEYVGLRKGGVKPGSLVLCRSSFRDLRVARSYINKCVRIIISMGVGYM
jgi:hypothetical protein